MFDNSPNLCYGKAMQSPESKFVSIQKPINEFYTTDKVQIDRQNQSAPIEVPSDLLDQYYTSIIDVIYRDTDQLGYLDIQKFFDYADNYDERSREFNIFLRWLQKENCSNDQIQIHRQNMQTIQNISFLLSHVASCDVNWLYQFGDSLGLTEPDETTKVRLDTLRQNKPSSYLRLVLSQLKKSLFPNSCDITIEALTRRVVELAPKIAEPFLYPLTYTNKDGQKSPKAKISHTRQYNTQPKPTISFVSSSGNISNLSDPKNTSTSGSSESATQSSILNPELRLKRFKELLIKKYSKICNFVIDSNYLDSFQYIDPDFSIKDTDEQSVNIIEVVDLLITEVQQKQAILSESIQIFSSIKDSPDLLKSFVNKFHADIVHTIKTKRIPSKYQRLMNLLLEGRPIEKQSQKLYPNLIGLDYFKNNDFDFGLFDYPGFGFFDSAELTQQFADQYEAYLAVFKINITNPEYSVMHSICQLEILKIQIKLLNVMATLLILCESTIEDFDVNRLISFGEE